MRIIFFCLAISFFFSCNNLKFNEKAKKDPDVVRQYRPDGSLKNEIPVKNNKRNGLAKTYYKSGKLQQSINYIDDIKHGLATTYYETGTKYMETPYDSGKAHGLRKKYRSNGQLMAEIPYFKGEETAGLKEYLLDGSEKTKYPEIKIKAIDEILLKNKYTLKFSVTNASRQVEFFVGKLDKNKTIPYNVLPLKSTKSGESELVYSLPPGMFIMEELNIIVKAKTKLGNPFITETSYNVAIENRGI